MATKALTPYVASVVDPFRGTPSQIPDFNGSATNVQKVVDYRIMPSAVGVTGATYMVIVPGLYACHYLSTTIDGAAGTMTALGAAIDSDSFTSLNTGGMFEYRITSANVTVDYIGSSTADAGRICVNTYAGTSPPVTVTIANLFNDDGYSGPAKLGASVNLKPFQPPSMSAATGNASTYMPIVVVAGLGLATGSSALAVRICYNIESIFNGESLVRQSAVFSPCDMSQCCHAANITGRSTIFAGGPNAYDKLVEAGLELAKVVAAKTASGTISSLLL